MVKISMAMVKINMAMMKIRMAMMKINMARMKIRMPMIKIITVMMKLITTHAEKCHPPLSRPPLFCGIALQAEVVAFIPLREGGQRGI